MKFFIGLLSNITAGLFKYHVEDETYNKVQNLFTFISIIVGIVFIGYFGILYLLFSGYEGKWLHSFLNYIYQLFNS